MTNLNGRSQLPGIAAPLPQQQNLPIHEKNTTPQQTTSPAGHTVSLELQHVSNREGLLVKIKPPKIPSRSIDHVSCDIVLVIDVSGSMGSAAPVPGQDLSEDTGLSVLDLTKHAALTIIQTMDERDRLGIVTFGTKSKIIQSLEPMTDDNKQNARNRISALQPIDSTNLWHGILDGIKLFDNEKRITRVPAIMVLTDGMPNHMCPSRGYIPKLKSMPPLPASIHTFGFGYSLRSGLLKSLAEFSGGNYAFIPDAGMIGTMFVHAVANLQSTYATKASLTLKYARSLDIQETMGDTVDKEAPKKVRGGQMQLNIPLGNIQYGQSRDIWLRIKDTSKILSSFSSSKVSADDFAVAATLSFKETETSAQNEIRASIYSNTPDTPVISETEIAYHESRARICKFLSSLFPVGSDGEHRTTTQVGELGEKTKELAQLIADLPARNFTDEKNQSLMEDLNGEEPKGQISLAINSTEFFQRWGQHFLPSYLNAHTRQVCNSFKDSGPLQYSVDSPLFIACRDRLDDAFDSLPPPEPSRVVYSYNVQPNANSNPPAIANGNAPYSSSKFSMSKYRNSTGVCFSGSTPVELASGRKVPIRKLRRGFRVRTPLGPRKVAMVMKTPVVNETLLRVDGVFVTPWHPLSVNGKTWDFPANMADKVTRYTGSVYSVLLQQDSNSRAHAIRVGELWGVTLGHGITRGSDVRAHEYFGDYLRVCKGLMCLPGTGKPGVVLGRGAERDSTTGRVMGLAGTKGRLAVRPGMVRAKSIML